nr:inositol monophosphatase family protein [uncultured Blautia sp.]
MKYLVNVIVDVLSVIYQTAGASCLLAVLIMCVYMLGRKQGVGPVARAWVYQFRQSSWFRRHFFLTFYTCMMLFRTILCRSVWGNPLENVLGIWGLHHDGKIYTENFENLILFMPFIMLLFWAREEKDHTKGKKVQEVLLNSFEISFCFSLAIETCQLFLKIGTFQLTDLCFNTLGGMIGGVIYWGFERTRNRVISSVKKLGGWDVVPISSPEPRYDAIENLVREAGKKLRKARPGEENIHKKEGLANFCTDYDTAIQRFLIQGLSEILPGAAFFGEEDTEGNAGAEAEGEFTFYIDPIDGTTNFMFDYHHSCVSVGLAHGDEMIAGFVYHPYVDDMYVAVKGHGSYLNGKRLHMADKPVEEGIVEFGCARYNEAGIDWLFCVVKEMFQNSLSIRCGGSAALGLCRGASGSNTVYLELKLQPYDYAAASVILEEAGGKITQIDGSPITLHEGCSIIGGTPAAWQESKDAFAKLKEKEPAE